jgi:tocopherol cyclase
MNHVIQGELKVKGKVIDFTDGRGYIEKDWGRSFPSAYVWMQSNHFKESNISIKASVANIPWIRNSFVGFIAGIWLQDKLIQFTTYNRSRLHKCQITKDKVALEMENLNYRLDIIAHRDHATSLASPILGMMDGRIEESMTSIIDVSLFNKKTNKILFEGKGKHAGLEVAGNIEEIII